MVAVLFLLYIIQFLYLVHAWLAVSLLLLVLRRGRVGKEDIIPSK